MDKRTLIYVALLSFLLFGVNWYFEAENQEAVKKWQLHQEAIKKTAALKPAEAAPKAAIGDSTTTPEQYFVLQNGAQQLVFSNRGGALAEINLPFQSKTDKASVVKEIDFDREMLKQEPQNAYFPAHSYKTGDGVQHETGELGGYYPLIRRDLIQKAGKKSVKLPPRYYSLNIVSDYPEVAELLYEVKEFTPNKIVFEANPPLRKITKTYTLADDYILNLDVKIEGDAEGFGSPPVFPRSSGSPARRHRRSSTVLQEAPRGRSKTSICPKRC